MIKETFLILTNKVKKMMCYQDDNKYVYYIPEKYKTKAKKVTFVKNATFLERKQRRIV